MGGTPISATLASAESPILDDEVGRVVLWPDLTPLLLPQPDQGLLVLAHDNAGVGAADERSAVDAG
jgi:hypothetical protein